MRRRRFLQVAASAGAVGALAGCTQSPSNNSSGDSPGADGEQSTDDPSTTDTPSGTASDQVTTPGDETTATPGTPPSDPAARTGSIDGVDYTISVTGSGCGNGARDNTVDDIEFEEDERTIVVTGTIDAANPCKVVDVSAIDHDEGDGSVTVTITTADPENGPEMCVQCLGAIDYEATFEFGDAFPNEASVVHDGQSGRRELASAAYGSSSASAPSPTPTTTSGE